MRKFFSLTLAAALILSANVAMAGPYLEGTFNANIQADSLTNIAEGSNIEAEIHAASILDAEVYGDIYTDVYMSEVHNAAFGDNETEATISIGTIGE